MSVKSKSFKAIKNMVFDDFGVVIDNDFAKMIRNSKSLMWTSTMLSHQSNGYQFKVTRQSVQDGGSFYSVAEWNRDMRNS